MRARVRIGRAATLFGAAVAGILAAHELDYRLIVPDPAHRHDLLLRSGHGYLSHAFAFALVATVVATFTAVALGFGRGRRGAGRRASMPHVALCLALVQSGGFIALEATERLIVGAPADDRLAIVTLAGVALQVVVAVAAAWLLSILERAGAMLARLATSFPRVPAARRSLRLSGRPLEALRPSVLAGGPGLRGPPLLSNIR